MRLDRLLSPEGDGGAAPPPPPRRAGSVTLRSSDSGAPDTSAMLDPANQSLADALGMMLRLVQLAMVVLIGLYLFSGLQSVQEGQRGVRLLFGKVEDSNLEPGMHLAAP